ncbi:MAG: STAS domain-containing protein [Austwickia sp.]|nr:STAS domain-containing protein [Austwickia sp.]
MADLEVSVTQERGIWVVTAVGDVDVSNAAKLRDALDRVLADGESRLVVDLRGVSFMDSTGLGILVGRLKVVRARRGSMRLVCVAPRMLRVLDITGLDTVFPLHESLADAVAALNPAGAGEDS